MPWKEKRALRLFNGGIRDTEQAERAEAFPGSPKPVPAERLL